MLKHLQAREDWDNKSLSAKGFTLIELLVVIVILGILAAVVIFAIGSVQDRAQRNACKTDAKTIRTAVAAWNTEYLGGNTAYATAYPANAAALASGTGAFLESPSTLWQFSSGTGGSVKPTLDPIGTGKCVAADA